MRVIRRIGGMLLRGPLTPVRNRVRAVEAARQAQERARLVDEITRRFGEQSHRIPCPACETPAEDHHMVAARERHGLPLVTAWCPTCGMAMFNPMPDAAFLSYFYAEVYQRFHRTPEPSRRIFNVESQRSGRLVGMVRDHLKPGATVLDIGASAGHVLAHLGGAYPDLGLRLTGVEPDRKYVDYANANVEGVTLHCAMFEDYRPTEAVDLILLMHTFEHIRDMGGCLRRVHEMLAPGGLLYIETPNLFNAGVAGSLEDFFLISKLYTFTPLTLRRYLAAHGFETVTLDDASDKHMFGLFRKTDRADPVVTDELLRDNARAVAEPLAREMGGAAFADRPRLGAA